MVAAGWPMHASASGAAQCLRPSPPTPTHPPSPVQVPHENAERIAARIPGAQLHTWEGWGHGWLDAGRFAAAVNAFLTAG